MKETLKKPEGRGSIAGKIACGGKEPGGTRP